MRRSLVLLFAVAACGGSVTPAAPVAVAPSHSSAPTAGPTKAPVRPAGPCSYALGQTLLLRDPTSSRRLDVTLSSASRSQHALASDHGSAPANGYYVTVQAKIVNRGAGTDSIDPQDFRADAAGRLRVTVTDGNAPYSGASSVLSTTPLDPGETITGPLTFDLGGPHGSVRYAPKGKTACSWAF